MSGTSPSSRDADKLRDNDHAPTRRHRFAVRNAKAGAMESPGEARKHALRTLSEEDVAALRESLDTSVLGEDSKRFEQASKNKIGLIQRPEVAERLLILEKQYREQEDEGAITDQLVAYFEAKHLPRELWEPTAAEIERVVRKQLGADHPRPLWDERAKDPELAVLSAPEFLKRVWADQIAEDGTIERDVIAARDKKLLMNVSTYISKREDRGKGLGRAAGLRLIGGRAGRPKRAGLE